jgi:hypothetical protein
VGDIVDLADFAKAVYTGTDKWGDEVGTIELALMALAVLPIVSGGVVSGARKAVRFASEGKKMAAEAATGFLHGAESYTRAMQQLEFVDNIAYQILMDYRGRFGDLRAVLQRAARSEGYIDYLDQQIPAAARRPESSVEMLNHGDAVKLLDAFLKLAGIMKRIDPPGKCLDDLLSDHTGEFRVWFFQKAYHAGKVKMAGRPPSPKQWLREHAPEYIRSEARRWLGEPAATIEFGSTRAKKFGVPEEFDEHIENIIEEASSGSTGIGRGFDYERFGSAAAIGRQAFPTWRPGLPVDWPNEIGKPPGYTSTVRKRAITNVAYFELLHRFEKLEEATGGIVTASMIKGKSQDEIVNVLQDEAVRGRLRTLDQMVDAKHGEQPFWQADLSIDELEVAVSRRGITVTQDGEEWLISKGAGRPDLGGNIQIEHVKPQRGYIGAMKVLEDGEDAATYLPDHLYPNLQARADLPEPYKTGTVKDQMILISGVSNPRNMVPVPWLDHMRADFYAAKNVGEESLLTVKYFSEESLPSLAQDARVGRRFLGWSNAEIVILTQNLQRHGRQPDPIDLESVTNWLRELRMEVVQRGLGLQVPRLHELGQ